MKRIVSMFVFILLLTTTMAVAQEEELPDAGITPDSILYGLDKAFERISLALTFNNAAKAEKRLQMASERLAELKAMTDKGKLEYSNDLAEEYDDNIKESNEIATTAKLSKEDKSKLTELTALTTSKHLSILDKIKEETPEQAKAAIERAMNKSAKGRETAVAALKKKGDLGDISEEVPVAVREKIPEKVRERIGIKGKPENITKW